MTDYELKQEAVVRTRSPAFLLSLLAASVIAGGVVAWFVLFGGSRPAAPEAVALSTETATTVPAASTTSTAPAVAVDTTEATTPPAAAAPVPQDVPAVPAPTQTVAVVQQPAPPAAPSPPPPEASAPAAVPAGGVLAELNRLKAEDQFSEARAKGLEALKAAPDGATRRAIEDLLSELAGPLLMSKRPLPEKIDYTVAAGDSLDKLARRFGTTVDLIRKGNAIPGQVIRLGTRLRILSGRLALTIDKGDNTLVVTLNDQFLKRYRVGTGQYSTTPTGTFKITGKVAQPTWYHPDGRVIPYGDKENLLGTHWMSIDVPGFGLHGTWEPDSVGKQSSQGCVRLANPDIEELFTIVPEGATVVIQD